MIWIQGMILVVLLVAWFIHQSYQSNGIEEVLFSENKIGKYPTDHLLWQMESKTKLKCAFTCGVDTECVSFLFNEADRKCYGCSTRMHDLISQTTTVTGGRFYELNGEMKNWTLEAWTGYSGTDAYVYMTIYGTSGASNPTELDYHSVDDFATNSVINYTIVASDFGTPWKIKVFHKQDPGDNYILNLGKIALYDATGTAHTFTNEVNLTEENPTAIFDRDSA